MERDHRAVVATFFHPGAFALGMVATLGQDAAHHMQVRRLASGHRVGLVNGVGDVASGTLVRLGRFDAEVAIDEVRSLARPPAVHLIVPVADRERMLWLAEKSAELGAASWRPAMWHRSRSVSPRGEGPRFAEKVRARMVAALEQSGGAWMPEVTTEQSLADVATGAERGTRLLLDRDGVPLLSALGGQPLDTNRSVTIVVGPEGGAEPEERAMLIGLGFQAVSVGTTILRFETAAVAALAAVRAADAARAVAPTGASQETTREGSSR